MQIVRQKMCWDPEKYCWLKKILSKLQFATCELGQCTQIIYCWTNGKIGIQIQQMMIRHTLRYRSYFSATVHKNLKIKRLKNASNRYLQDVEYSSIYIWTISCKNNTNYLSHVTSHSPVTSHILRKLIILA